MDRQPHHDRWPTAPVDDDDRLDDGDSPSGAPPVTVRIGSRLGVSLPAALGAAVLVTAMAFGANALRIAAEPITTGHEGLEPGTYWFRVQAIRVTELGKFITAQTDVAQVVVP